MIHRRSWRPGVRAGYCMLRCLVIAALVSIALAAAVVAGEWTDDFETDRGWITTGLWHLTETDSHSPTQSYWFGQEATGDYNTGGLVEGCLTSPQITVDGCGLVYLSFWYRRDVDRGSQYSFPTDATTVQVRFDHGPWGDPIWERDSHDWSVDMWLDSGPIPIAVPAGVELMQIAFCFDSVDARRNYYRGWFIDDVIIEGGVGCLEPPPVEDPVLDTPGGDQCLTGPGPATTSVDATSATDGATVHFTVDGSDPTCLSPEFPANFDVGCDAPVILKAIACKDALQSNIVEETYFCRDCDVPLPTCLVRFVYLIPDDRTERPENAQGIERAVQDLRLWFYDQLGTETFRMADPIVETYATPNLETWYETNPNGDANLWFVNNVADDAFAVTGGMYDDPDFLWVYIIDAEPDCSQKWYLGDRGVVVLPRHVLDGLVGDKIPVPPCLVTGVDGSGEWIGLMAKYIGFALGLSEPPGCVDGNPGTPCPEGALMWTGYLDYPDCYLFAAEQDALREECLFDEIDPLLGSWYDTMEFGDTWASTGLWHYTDVMRHSPTHAYWFADPVTQKYGPIVGLAGLGRGDRPAVAPRATFLPVSGELTSPAIAVEGGTEVMLSFWYWREVEYYIGGVYDVTTVEVAYDGGPWEEEEVWRKDSTSISRKSWVLSGALLNVPLGVSTLQVRFVFDTVDPYVNAFRGWVIDDVRLYPVVDRGVLPTAFDFLYAPREVAEASPIQVACIPSPVRDVHTARFTVLDADIEGLIVQIFDLGGVLVWEAETQDSEIVWHTESSFGDFVANGVYLYRSLVKIDNVWIDTGLNKLTVLR